MWRFLARHWYWVAIGLLALGLLIAYPGSVGTLTAIALGVVGFLVHLVRGGSGNGGIGATGWSPTGAKADVDSSLEGLKRTAEEGKRGTDETRNALDDGASAIDRALEKDSGGKGS